MHKGLYILYTYTFYQEDIGTLKQRFAEILASQLKVTDRPREREYIEYKGFLFEGWKKVCSYLC